MSERQVQSTPTDFGIYLSSDALAAAMEIHASYLAHNMNFNASQVARLQSFLDTDDWSDFDSIYLFLYQISLLNGSKIRHMNPGTKRSDYIADRSNDLLRIKSEDSQLVRVDFLLDIKLQRIKNRYALLDEFAVHSLMAFAEAFTKHMIFNTKMSYIDIGCVALSFCVEVPHAFRLGQPFGIADKTEIGSSLVERRLSMPYWETLRERFSVQDQHIETIHSEQ